MKLLLWRIFLAGLLGAVLLEPRSLAACTTMCLADEEAGVQLFAANYDWEVGSGLVVTNPRGVAKRAFKVKNPHEWTSKYGSITFNQYGVEFPICGMNEKGLVIGTMWLSSVEYPAPDERPALLELQWIQHQLDTKATVAELLETLEEVRIEPYVEGVGIHHLISDATGDAAIIEPLNGKYKVYHGKRLPTPALTNHTYSASIRAKRAAKELPVGKKDSLSRFMLAADSVESFDVEYEGSPPTKIDEAFQALDWVKIPGYTKWSMVFDQRNEQIYWHTDKLKEFGHVDLADFEYGCLDSRMILDIAEPAEHGENMAAKFEKFSIGRNMEKTYEAFRGTRRAGLDKVSQHSIQIVAAYPARLKCASVAEKK